MTMSKEGHLKSGTFHEAEMWEIPQLTVMLLSIAIGKHAPARTPKKLPGAWRT